MGLSNSYDAIIAFIPSLWISYLLMEFPVTKALSRKMEDVMSLGEGKEWGSLGCKVFAHCGLLPCILLLELRYANRVQGCPLQ